MICLAQADHTINQNNTIHVCINQTEANLGAKNQARNSVRKIEQEICARTVRANLARPIFWTGNVAHHLDTIFCSETRLVFN